MIRPNQVPRLKHIQDILLSTRYKEGWNWKVDMMGMGHYVQVILPDINPATGTSWKGRKWYISGFATDSEIVATLFKAYMVAEEHETREAFRYQGVQIYGPHQSLEALVKNAEDLDHRH